MVSIEWLWDTLERGMILNEELYDPVLPKQDRGLGAWNRTHLLRTSLGKRVRKEPDASTESSKRRLRRTASIKLNSQNQRIWGDIVGGRPSHQLAEGGPWEVPRETIPRLPTSRNDKTNPDSSISRKDIEPSVVDTGMFGGCGFYHYGFSPERGQILRDHLLAHGGRVSDSALDMFSALQQTAILRLFMVVPHDFSVSQHPPVPSSQPPLETVTIWWLERCLHHRKFLEPTEHVIGRPFRNFPVKEFLPLSISTSAFTGIDLLHVTRAIQLLGATYNEDLIPQSSVIVVRSPDHIRKDKFDYAQEWGIPIVSADWLWESIDSGKLLSFQPYRVRSRSQPRPVLVNQKHPLSLLRTTDISSASASDSDIRLGLKVSSKGTKSNGTALSTHGSANHGHVSRPACPPGRVEQTALDSTDLLAVKVRHDIDIPGPGIVTLAAAIEEEPCKSEPLSNRHPNVSLGAVSTAPAPSDHPTSKTVENYSLAISDLLAKTKTRTTHIPKAEIPKAKRGPNRILGRVTSNMSAGSAAHSRATSVDSTATEGHPVQYSTSTSSATANERIKMLMKVDADHATESQLPATQLEYDDPESREAEERAMARMMGGKPTTTSGTSRTRKTLTIGDIGYNKSRTRSGRDRALA